MASNNASNRNSESLTIPYAHRCGYFTDFAEEILQIGFTIFLNIICTASASKQVVPCVLVPPSRHHGPTLWWGFLSGEPLVYFFIFVGPTESGEPAVVPVLLLLANARSGIDS